ncbi:MAG: acetyltransferase [Bacteroidetes bacterium]|nr:acetyltransferase [Bacteroidota bacterium]
MENPVIIFGTGPIGRSARDIFEANGNMVYGYLDDRSDLHGTQIDEITVLGNTDDDGFLKLIGKKCEAFVAADDLRLRKSLVKMLNDVRHVQPVNAVHQRAGLSPLAIIGHGNYFAARTEVGPGASIGNHGLFHTGSQVGAECVVGHYVQIGAGAVINPGVIIEDDVFIGSGAIVVSGVKLGKGARIGAGSVVIAPVAAGETVFGNPAKPVKS